MVKIIKDGEILSINKSVSFVEDKQLGIKKMQIHLLLHISCVAAKIVKSKEEAVHNKIRKLWTMTSLFTHI